MMKSVRLVPTMLVLYLPCLLFLRTTNGQLLHFGQALSNLKDTLNTAAEAQGTAGPIDGDELVPVGEGEEETVDASNVDLSILASRVSEALENPTPSTDGSQISIASEVEPLLFGGVVDIIEQCILPNLYIDGRPRNAQPRSAYEEKTFDVEDIKDVIRFDKKPPKTMEGIFWLNYDEFFAEVTSFAFTPERGGLNPGRLKNRPYPLRQRVLGDRQWAQIGFGPEIQFLVDLFDVKFNYELLEGTLKFPIKFRIIFDLAIPGTCFRFQLKDCFEELLNLEITLQNTPREGDQWPDHPDYPDSVVWLRTTTTLGNTGPGYEAIQIVNGMGMELQPAYDDFITAMTTGARAPLNGEFVYNELTDPLAECVCPGKFQTFDELPFGI